MSLHVWLLGDTVVVMVKLNVRMVTNYIIVVQYMLRQVFSVV